MKVSETVHHQDGTTSTREFNIELEPGKTSLAWALAPVDEEPISIRIIESGWRDHGKPMYHVLSEYGAYEETSYSHLSQQQLLETYPEFQQILDARFKDTVVTGDFVSRLANDTDLGKFVRRESNNLKF